MGVALGIGLNNLILLSNIAKYSKAYQEAAEILYSPSFSQQILLYGILIPIVEEVIFRGAIFNILRRWIPFVWAMLISAVAFGVFHGNLVQFIYASLCGLFLAYAYEKTKSIFASIFSHIAMNIVAYVMTEYEAFTWIFHDIWRVLGITICCGILFVTLLLIVRKWMLQKC